MSKHKTTIHPQQDGFEQFLTAVNAFWSGNRKSIYIALGILIVGTVVALSLKDRQDRANSAGQEAFSLAIAKHFNDPTLLTPALQQIATEHPGTPYADYSSYLVAQQKLSANQNDEALTWFETCLATKDAGDFVYAEAFEGKGVALEALGRIDEAKVAYKKVLSLKEGAHRYAQVNLKLALLARSQSDDQAAVKYFQAIINNDDAPTEAHAIATKELAVLQ